VDVHVNYATKPDKEAHYVCANPQNNTMYSIYMYATKHVYNIYMHMHMLSLNTVSVNNYDNI
jgi:hypothetical protein